MEFFEKFGIFVCFVILAMTFNLVLAFPFMWMWNHVCNGVFGFPVLDWSESFCLMTLTAIFVSKPSIHTKN